MNELGMIVIAAASNDDDWGKFFGLLIPRLMPFIIGGGIGLFLVWVKLTSRANLFK